MAMDNKVINGSDILLKLGDTASPTDVLACSTSHTIEITNSVLEISCKGSGDFTSSEYGRFSWSITTDALLNLGLGATYISYTDLLDLQLAKTIIYIDSSYDQDGDSANTYNLEGQCIITSISQTAPDSDNASYSVTLQGRGALTSTLVEAA